MSAKQHTIELNGQRYDALTGAIVSSKPVTSSKSTAKKSAGGNIDGFSRATKPSLSHHQTEKSKTLMRKVVSKPLTKPVVKSTSSIKSSHASLHRHTALTQKSPFVSKFGTPALSSAPVDHDTTPAATQTVTSGANTDHISRAIDRATSHEQQKLKKPRLNHRIGRKLKLSPRTVSGASFALAFLLIGGFVTYQNIPGLTMRLASARSGVQGSLPNYQPAGFSLNGSVAYKPGQITINYKSNSDDRTFRVSQNTSAWDSQSLLDNYVAVNRRDFQTVQDKGKTIYIYDGDNATWVDGGIWYRVEGESRLSSDQLLHIAASL